MVRQGSDYLGFYGSIVDIAHDEAEYSYRMTDLQAAVGLSQLNRLDDMLSRRRALAERYSERLSRLLWLQVPTEPKHCRHNYSYMVRLAPMAPVSVPELAKCSRP